MIHRRPPRHRFAAFVAMLWAGFCGAIAADGTAKSGVELVQTGSVIQVHIDGQRFTDYHYQDVSRPFLYPILGPGGVHLTRRWPQEEVPNEERDHPHHHALWWSHGLANDIDFWSEGAKAGRTVHQKFLEVKSGKKVGRLRSLNEWRSKEGQVIATDERTLKFHRSPAEARLMDFEITIHASNGDLILGDTKEGTLAIRIAESMRLKQPKNQPGAGHIVMSTGDKDGDTWGKRAAWCDYYGPSEGRTVGITIMDHPTNPRHPTWWHVRDYGLFAANPFGIHDFEKKPKGTGDLKVAAGSKVTFRYRFLFHDGDTTAARVAERFVEYTKDRSVTKR